MKSGLIRASLVALTILAPGPISSSAPAPAESDPDAGLPKLMNKQIVAAVERGLNYLARTQQPDGSIPAKWEARDYPAAMTSLAGLALLASGSTPEEGPYAENIKRAMTYLMDLGDAHPQGLIAGKEEARCTYGHGFGMMFLAQCYGMEQNKEYEERLKRVLDKAIGLVAHGQSPRGGWLYSPIGGSEEGSTTACVLQGLRACRNAGLKVPTETIDKAVGYLKFCQNPDGGLFYSTAFKGGSLPAISAAAITCFYAAGVYDQRGGNTESATVDKLWRFVDNNTKDFSDRKSFKVYLNFYLSQAKYQRGGADWESYYNAIARDLLALQSPNGTWPGEDVGPTYGTAVACFVLQLPYGYLPVCEK